MAIIGLSATRFSSESVIIVAISMIRSCSGSRPVISRSIHTKRLWSGILFFLCGLVWELVQVWLCFPETAPCGTSMWRFCSAIHGSAHFRKAQPHLHFGLHCWPRVELKPTPWLVVLAGDTFPGVSEAKDGFSQAHRDVLVASPGKVSPASTCTHVRVQTDMRQTSETLPIVHDSRIMCHTTSPEHLRADGQEKTEQTPAVAHRENPERTHRAHGPQRKSRGGPGRGRGIGAGAGRIGDCPLRAATGYRGAGRRRHRAGVPVFCPGQYRQPGNWRPGGLAAREE